MANMDKSFMFSKFELLKRQTEVSQYSKKVHESMPLTQQHLIHLYHNTLVIQFSYRHLPIHRLHHTQTKEPINKYLSTLLYLPFSLSSIWATFVFETQHLQLYFCFANLGISMFLDLGIKYFFFRSQFSVKIFCFCLYKRKTHLGFGLFVRLCFLLQIRSDGFLEKVANKVCSISGQFRLALLFSWTCLLFGIGFLVFDVCGLWGATQRLFLMISSSLLCLYIVKVQIFMLLMDLTLKWCKEIFVVF